VVATRDNCGSIHCRTHSAREAKGKIFVCWTAACCLCIKPLDFQGDAGAGGDNLPDLPQFWRAVVDKKTNRTYYVNE